MKEIYDRTLSLLRAGATKQFDGDGSNDVDVTSSHFVQTPNPSRETSPPSRCLSPLPPHGSVSGSETPMMCSSGESSPLKIVGDFSAQHPLPNEVLNQLRIDSQGKLTKSSAPPSQTIPNSSRCCSRTLDGITTGCSFCGKLLCGQCSRTCGICVGKFCSVCSLLEYRSTGEETLCLTCESNEMT